MPVPQQSWFTDRFGRRADHGMRRDTGATGASGREGIQRSTMILMLDLNRQVK